MSNTNSVDRIRKKLNPEVVAELAMILISIIFISHSIPLFGKAVHHDVGPGLFPLLAGVAGLLCGLFGSIVLWLKKSWTVSTEHCDSTIELASCKLAAVVAVYIFLTSWLGFTLSTALFSVCVAWLFGARKWLTIILVSIGVSAGTYLIFVRLLSVDLPRGLMGF